jgi:hypothetical protein
MLGPAVTLLFLALALGWAVVLRGGAAPLDWLATLLFIGCISALFWFSSERRLNAPPLKAWLRFFIWVVPCYAAFQLASLPLPLLAKLSPARAALAEAVAVVVPSSLRAPLSVNPPAGVFWFFTLLGYVITFLLVRELGWRFARTPWIPVIPLVVLAVSQAAIGLLQVSLGGSSVEARGTYASREHFCGLLEMVLPLTVVYGLALLRHSPGRFATPRRAVLVACGMWTLSAFLLLAIYYSTSRSGLLSALFSLFVIAACSVGLRLPVRMRHLSAVTAIALALGLLLIFFPLDQFLHRFAEISSTGKLPAGTRLFVWKQTLPLIAEFPWFGCGLGGFEATFLKYQGMASGFRVQFANNDYLQYLVELGFVGAALLTAVLIGVLAPVFRGIRKLADEERRLLVVGCAGSVVAIALHSLVDFNMHIPANAMTLTWIVGIGSINGLD